MRSSLLLIITEPSLSSLQQNRNRSELNTHYSEPVCVYPDTTAWWSDLLVMRSQDWDCSGSIMLHLYSSLCTFTFHSSSTLALTALVWNWGFTLNLKLNPCYLHPFFRLNVYSTSSTMHHWYGLCESKLSGWGRVTRQVESASFLSDSSFSKFPGFQNQSNPLQVKAKQQNFWFSS